MLGQDCRGCVNGNGISEFAKVNVWITTEGTMGTIAFLIVA